MLLRRNIVIDAETAQLVAAAVQAALQVGAPSRPPRRAHVFPLPVASRRSGSGSCPGRGGKVPVRYSILVIMEQSHRTAAELAIPDKDDDADALVAAWLATKRSPHTRAAYLSCRMDIGGQRS